MAVNVSAVEFRDKDFVERVRKTLSETGLQPQYLELELTEGILMEDAESTVNVLQDLRTLGIRLAVDDFGTGYSSLSYLRRFPIDILKIDQSFVHQIFADSDDSTIVKAIINMGRSLMYHVVAEGIETPAQLAFLQSQGCAEGPGYLFSSPLAAAPCSHLLQHGRADAISREGPALSALPAVSAR